MIFIPISISGAWLIKANRFQDDRGWFQEWFKQSVFFEATGFDFVPVQTNISRSAAGSIRGIHYSTAALGQGKLVTVMEGSIDDVVVDVRPSSPTFGKWEKIRLSSDMGDSVLLSPNLGHAFQALTDNTTVSYLVTAEFNPTAEKGISPFCPILNIEWDPSITPLVSQKDIDAPSLSDQQRLNNLPS
jgi:dTDP-4-dehydrorhamnose 3,5-epimerase